MGRLSLVPFEADGDTVSFETGSGEQSVELLPSETIDILETFHRNTNLTFLVIRDFNESSLRYLIYQDGLIFKDDLLDSDEAGLLFDDHMNAAAFMIVGMIYAIIEREL